MTYFENPKITDWQKQIIMGTILGGSSIVKPAKGRNCYLFMRSKHRDWLTYKTAELGGFSSQRPFNLEGNTLRWHSNCYPIFNDFHALFYKNGVKTITMQALDQLRDIGLAIWFGDAGKSKKDTLILNTHKFGQKGNKIISQYFREVGIGKTEIITERKSLRLSFTPDSSKKFLMIIGDRLPEFMQKKLFGA